MRFTEEVTEAHRWWTAEDVFPGFPTITATGDGSPVPHTACASAFRNHGELDGQSVCPGEWVVKKGDGFVLQPHNPVLAPTGETVHWVMDCRECEVRATHPDEDFAQQDGGAHLLETGHTFDTYEVVRP